MDVAGTLFLLGLQFFAAVLGDVKFSVSDCSQNRESELLGFTSAQVTSYPIPVPGDIHVTGALAVHRDATGDVSLDVTFERYLGFFWLDVPCISDVGSCKYPNACGMLSSAFGNGTAGCPAQMVDANIPCTCPIPAGTYTLNNALFSIPEVSGIWSWLAEGDYRVTAKLIDNPTGQELACQHVEMTLVDGHPSCSGFLCSIFG